MNAKFVRWSSMKRERSHRRGHMDWEAIFHGSRRRISTVIIGCEADFRSRKRIPREEASTLIRRLKEHVNLSYDSEPAIAKQIGVDEGALNGWLAGKVKPTFQSLLKVRDFLQRQVETRARQWTDHSHLLHAGPPRHAQRLVLFSIVIRPKRHAKV